MAHTGTIHIMLLEMLTALEVLILSCFWILRQLCLSKWAMALTYVESSVQRCQAGKWNSFLMRCTSEFFSQMCLASLIKKNEIASFSPRILISLNWSAYIGESSGNNQKCFNFVAPYLWCMWDKLTPWLMASDLLICWKITLSTPRFFWVPSKFGVFYHIGIWEIMKKQESCHWNVCMTCIAVPGA